MPYSLPVVKVVIIDLAEEAPKEGGALHVAQAVETRVAPAEGA